MTETDIKALLQPLCDDTAKHAKEIVASLYGVDSATVHEGRTSRWAAATVYAFADLLSQRDVVAELNGLLENNNPTLRAVAELGLPNPDVAKRIPRLLATHTSLLNKDARQLDVDDIHTIRRNLSDNSAALDVAVMQAFLRAYEEGGRQFPLAYEEKEIILRLSASAAETFETLARKLPTDNGLLHQLRYLAQDL